MESRVNRLSGFILGLVAALLVGCSAHDYKPFLSRNPPTINELLSGDALVHADNDLHDVIGHRSAEETDLLATDAPMLEFLQRFVPQGASAETKAKKLVVAIMHPGIMGLKYDRDVSLSAKETFNQRRGNCISFTNLFVALSRAAGLRAGYQLAYVLPDWDMQENFKVLNRHVTAYVRLGGGDLLTVDFEQIEPRLLTGYRRISDAHAEALFHGNIGVANMLAGDVGQAVRQLAAAIRSDRSVGAAWVNLGALYSRLGLPQYAEVAYLESVRRDPNELLAYSNLANLYQLHGPADRAQEFADRARTLRQGNPYFHFALARQAHEHGDYQISNGHLRRALALKNGEPEFLELQARNNRLLAQRSG